MNKESRWAVWKGEPRPWSRLEYSRQETGLVRANRNLQKRGRENWTKGQQDIQRGQWGSGDKEGEEFKAKQSNADGKRSQWPGQERVLRQKGCEYKSKFKEKSFLMHSKKTVGKTELKPQNFYISWISEPQTDTTHRHKAGVYTGVLPSAWAWNTSDQTYTFYRVQLNSALLPTPLQRKTKACQDPFYSIISLLTTPWN